MQWYTTDLNAVGTYTVRITANTVCTTSYKEFTVTVKSCASDTFTINAAMFLSPSLTYNIKGTASPYSWTDSDVTSDSGFTSTQCGTFTWTVMKVDGLNAIDPIFTYTSATKTIFTYTTDFAKAATYIMRI